MSLLLSVVVAREAGTEALGQFGVAYAVYLFVLLVCRETGVNSFLASLPSIERRREYARRTSLLGVIGSLIALVAGLALGSTYILILGAALHGAVLLDYSKVLSLSIDDSKVALRQDGVVLVSFLACLGAVLFDVVGSEVLFAVWIGTSAIVGYVSCYWQKYRLVPAWISKGRESRVTLVFGLQAILGAGSAHILTLVLAGVAGQFLVGSLRGASTIVGPVNLVVTTVKPLVISYLARTGARQYSVSLRSTMRLTALLSLGVIILLAAVSIIAFYFGDFILGEEVWSDSSTVFVYIAANVAVVAMFAVPAAAHRTMWASGRAVTVGIAIGLVRFPLVIGGALVFGVEGAAAGFLIASTFGLFAWWASLVQLIKSQTEHADAVPDSRTS